ncbi:MAG TPA: hypothetical protein VNX28_02310 [Gemmataceae bacterium]|nr:hypothetical protein [Gemmataceae bacterium]
MGRQQRLVVVVAAWFLAVLPALGQTPQDALKVVPEKASGFVIVNNLGELTTKIETLARRVGMPLPFSLLEKIKGELGVGAGLNTKGSLLVAVILEEGADIRPIRLVYVPVTDYAAFLKGLNAHPDGSIATVQLANGAKQMIVARQGSFAVFAEPTDKDALQEALRSTPATNAALAPLASRIARNDATGVVTSRGIKLGAGKARAALAMGKNAAQLPPEQQFILGFMDSADAFLKSVESDVTHVLLGSRLDQAGNLEVDSAALFAANSGFAQVGAKATSSQGERLAGLPDVPYLFAFDGSMSGSLMGEIMNFGMKVVTAMIKDVPAAKVQKLEQVAGRIVKDLRSMSMVVGSGTGQESLFQNSYVVIKVANAQAYLKNYEDYLDAYQDMMKGIKLPEGFPNQSIKSAKIKVEGLPALEVTTDLGLGSNQIEPLKKMMEVYFGPGGKMVVSTVAVDKNTLLLRYTPAAELKEFIKTFKEKPAALANKRDIAQTAKLLPEGSQWVFFISPHGTVTFVHRIMSAMMAQPAGAMRVLEFPQTPPIGVGVKMSATGVEKRLVIPAAVLDAIGPFIRQIHDAKGAASSP